MSNEQTDDSLNFQQVLTLIFITLKLTGYINWSWWWVWSPIWITFLVLFLFGFLSNMYKNRKQAELDELINKNK